MLYGGVDYHKRYSQVTVMNERGEIKRSARLANEPEEFQRLLEELGEPCELALEAGRNWGLLYDWLEGKVERVHLVHPLKVKAIAWAKIKTDAIDSRTLAHLLRADLYPKGWAQAAHGAYPLAGSTETQGVAAAEDLLSDGADDGQESDSQPV